MLTQYENDLKNLLQSPGAPNQLYSTTNLDRWINIARGQVASESESIRVIGTIPTVVGQRAYNFSSISLGTSSVTGVQGVIHVRRISYSVGQNTQGLAGQQWIPSRPWEWFDLYNINNVVPTPGPPTTWSQFGQGSASTGVGSNLNATGSFYIDPPPDIVYTLNCDCVCYPIQLVDDTTIEALLYLWTDCVPFFAAYYAYLSSQTGARQADAERMMGHYKEFLQRARQAANPSVSRWQYEQATDPAQAIKMGLKPNGAGAG